MPLSGPAFGRKCYYFMPTPNLQRCIRDAPIRPVNWSLLGTALSYFQNQNGYKQELGMKTDKTSEDSQNKKVQRIPADEKVGTDKVKRTF